MKFEQWFHLQFGKRTSKTTIQHLWEKRDILHTQLNQVEKEISAMQDYITRKDAAYKAWLAKEKN